MSVRTFDRRLAELILTRVEFTVDNLTDNGTITLDGGAHEPNGRQNGLGAYLRGAHTAGHIIWTGDVDRSRAPHRKGGLVRVWIGTDAGLVWAKRLLGQP